MEMTDINRVSEDVLVPLFSEIYGHTDLKNLNVSECPNFPAIDLGDKETGTAYQITSISRSEKIKDTLRKFVKHELYKEYSKLIIYILTEKQKTYQGRGFDEIIQGKFSFDKDNDIRDFQDLLREILGFSLEQSLRVQDILEQHFAERQENNHYSDSNTRDDEPENPLDWLEKVNNSWGEGQATIRINRAKLRNDLQDFALRGSGVIIGSPGVGKTYLLRELRRSLKFEGIPHLLLPIEQLEEGTGANLPRGLSDESDLIAKLKSLPVSNQKAILLFDAFDAARNEQNRKHILRLIRRIIQELNGLWNVVVTVRTYDARKSQELLDLFGILDAADLTRYHSEGILCRHFTIPPLNEAEIRQALNQIGCPESIYNSGSQDLKCLLANPFNLWLLEKILKPQQDVPDFSQIRSEVQLLGLFWHRRIEGAGDEDHRLIVLKKVAGRMVQERSLTVRHGDIYEDLDLDKTAIQRAWNNLLSDEILAKVSSTGQHIAFSHNILFDYAISVLLIDDKPQQLERFVREDSSRPIFLRPSLTYSFTRLWYDDDAPENFWNTFWHVFRSNQSAHLRLARLIPTSVIAHEARNITQLTPLSDKLERGESIANDAMACLLQSLRTLEIERDESDELWSDFFDRASAYLHRKFAWELATLTSAILERPKNSENKAIIDACGRVGRRLLEWIWQERETSEDDWYNRLGSYWAVPLVARTYGTNVEEYRTLLEKVLTLKRGDHFSMDSLTRLAEDVDKIWVHDPEFVGSIYRAGITSTRGHNDIACHARLVEHFPDFIRAVPLTAAQAVIQGLNSYTHTFRDPQAGVAIKEMFSFRGKSTCFVEDNGYAWNELRIFLAEPTKNGECIV